MVALTLNKVKSNIDNIIKTTIDNQEETLVVTDEGAVVLVEHEYWNSIMETIRLMNDKRSLTALLEGIEARKNGKKLEGKSIEEIFDHE